jgi:hypothetical protein
VNTKPDKNVEVPPYDHITEGYYKLLCAITGHQFKWKTIPKKQYQQQVCEICGMTGETRKNKKQFKV